MPSVKFTIVHEMLYFFSLQFSRTEENQGKGSWYVIRVMALSRSCFFVHFGSVVAVLSRFISRHFETWHCYRGTFVIRDVLNKEDDG